MGRAGGGAGAFVQRLLCMMALRGAVPAAFARVNPPHPAVDPRHVDGSFRNGVVDLTSTWLLQQGDDPNGEEIVALPSLPLGLAGAQEFGEVSGRLPAGKRMVLTSDGVVEARSAKG